MRPNIVKMKILAGEPAFGCFAGFPSAELLEFCGHLGFEWCWLDAEHAPFGVETAAHMVRACESAGLVPMVRVAVNDPSHILGYLEIGMKGIMVPHIATADGARRAVNAMRYSPEGCRGAGSHTRAANYGLTQTAADYFERANRETLVVGIVEDREGFMNLAEILRVDGLDAIALGSGDLAMSLGLRGQPDHPQVRALMKRAEEQVVASGKALDAIVANAEEAKQAIARGARLISIGISTMLRQAGRAFLEGVRA